MIFVPLFTLFLFGGGEVPGLENPYDPRPLMPKPGDQKSQFHFLVFGDAKHSPYFSTVLKKADSLNPEFAITTADLVQKGGGKSGAKSYAKLDKQGGWFFRKYPTWPTFGNHEDGGGSDSAQNFKEFFGLDPYYSFTYANSVFIALGWTPKVKDNPEIFQWLESQLKKAKGKHIFVFQHRPHYTVGKKTYSDVAGKRTKTTRLFAKYRVRAVFSGHDHIYYRTVRDGVNYVISAGAGASIYPLSREKDAVQGDVYYGKETGSGKGYRFHFGSGRPDQKLDSAIYYVVSIKVDGEKVSLTMIDAKDGKIWDQTDL